MHKIYFIIVFCFIATISNQAFADCTNPAKSEGFIIYNKDHKVAQFCNGTDWIGMAGGTTSIMTGDTMVEGWPDAIVCNIGPTAYVFNQGRADITGSALYMYQNGSSVGEVSFANKTAATGVSSGAFTITNCNKSISQLYTDGQAFNFVGGQPVITDTLTDLSCTDGQMVLYDTATTAWICADVTASGAADNLGNHTATQTLDMASYGIDNVESITLDSVVGGAAPQVGGADNLGNHTATQNIVLGANYLSGDGGDEGVFVDASGNVGIGTVSPTAKLHIVGTLKTDTGDGDDAIIMRNSGNGGQWSFKLAGNGVTANNLNVGLGGSTFMAVASNGNVGIGTINPADKLVVTGNMTITGQGYKPGGGSWAATSDIRLKDIDGKYVSGLSEVVSLQPLKFHYKRDNPRGEPSDKQFVGLSAQDAMKVMPELVTLKDDGYYSLDPSALTYALINAVKELKAENDALRAEHAADIEALRAANDNFRKELDEVKAAIAK